MIASLFDLSDMTDMKEYNSMPSVAECSVSVASGSSSVSSSTSSAASGPSKKTKKSKIPDKTKTLLPSSFEPDSHTVLCGRSRDCYESQGNRRFRLICNVYLQQYLDAPGKLEKSRIVTTVMKKIRDGRKSGVFVTCESDGRYYEVSQRTAREKVGGFFRDSLPAEYKSSAKAKLLKKRCEVSLSSTSAAASGCSSSISRSNRHCNSGDLTFPMTDIFAPQQVVSQPSLQQQQQQQHHQAPPLPQQPLVESIDEMETLEESPDFLTGGIFANEPLPVVPFIGSNPNHIHMNTLNNNNNQGEDGKCDFVGATFFDIECL